MLGKELRDYRIEHGYLQKEIAETLGISASLLSRIERGKREVTVEEERKILELFPELAKEKLPGKYTVYTDGGCGFNPGGPGGIGAVILDAEGKVIQEISKGFHASTNNRMELLAAIEALKTIPAGAEVKVSPTPSIWSRLWKKDGAGIRTMTFGSNWMKLFAAKRYRLSGSVATTGTSGTRDVTSLPRRGSTAATKKKTPGIFPRETPHR